MIQIDNYLLANIRNVYQTRKSYRYSLLLHVIKDFLLISVLHIANKKKKKLLNTDSRKIGFFNQLRKHILLRVTNQYN